MTEQSERDAAVAVITEAFNTGHDATPEDGPHLEKHRRHDGHEHHYACWLCMNLAGLLAGHIADALAERGLLVSAEPAADDVVQLDAQLEELCTSCGEKAYNHPLGELCAVRDMVETVADALAEVRLQIGPNTRSLIADGHWKQMPLSVGERRMIAEMAVAAVPKLAVSQGQVHAMAAALHELDCPSPPPVPGMHHDDHWKAWVSTIEYALERAGVPVQDGDARGHG